MKKMTRILSAALVAVMVLSLSAVAMAADETTVFIPTKLPSLIGDISLADYKYPTLKVVMSEKVALGNPCPIVAGEDADYLFTFSEKPDWAGAVVSELDGGWINIDVDDDGKGIIEGPLVRQPGMWSYSGPCTIDPATGRCKPAWYGNGGDYPYYAGKDYGDYSVEVCYHRNGSAYRVTVTLKDSEDFFKTGNEGGVMKITFEKVTIKSTTEKKPGKTFYTTVWYVAQVSATYAEGPKVIGVETDWRNDKKETLASYRIVYAMSDGVYKITYAPTTTTIKENPNEDLSTYTTVCKFKASSNAGGVSYHHYTADEAIFGLYFKTRQDWEDDNAYAVSGSGWKVHFWYKWNGRDKIDGGDDENSDVIYRNNNGGQIKNIKYSTMSSAFKSPRVVR